MKRISPGTVTIGVIAILFGLLTGCVARHYFGGSPAQAPKRRTAAAVAPKVKGQQPLPAAGHEYVSPNGRAARNVPTLAPPQDKPSLAAGGRFERGPRGQVIYVQVEAEGAARKATN